MEDAIDWTTIIVTYGPLILLVGVLVDQLGLPFPATPLLLGAGALARSGELHPLIAVGVPIGAAVLAHLAWYEAGRLRGASVLGLMCRMSLEPDVCVRETRDFFSRHGQKSLLVARFVPGVDVIAPPLAGLIGVGRLRFVVLDGAGAALWAVVLVTPGYVFSAQLEQAMAAFASLGAWLLAILGALLAVHVGRKAWQRRRALRDLAVARVEPREVWERMSRGDAILVIDLRQDDDVLADPRRLPKSRRMRLSELDERHHEIPRDHEVVIFCTCPNEASAARAALLLKRRGIERVRPLRGGLTGWHEAALPFEADAARG